MVEMIMVVLLLSEESHSERVRGCWLRYLLCAS